EKHIIHTKPKLIKSFRRMPEYLLPVEHAGGAHLLYRLTHIFQRWCGNYSMHRPYGKATAKRRAANGELHWPPKSTKRALVMKQAMYRNMTPPSYASTHCNRTRSSVIKKALQPAKDKLASLCSIVDVLESEVDAL
ncbi:hypothetical protein HAX54_030992, partial [Datura stramonium]|nr:hypothetical protein [Datura stramonium]